MITDEFSLLEEPASCWTEASDVPEELMPSSNLPTTGIVDLWEDTNGDLWMGSDDCPVAVGNVEIGTAFRSDAAEWPTWVSNCGGVPIVLRETLDDDLQKGTFHYVATYHGGIIKMDCEIYNLSEKVLRYLGDLTPSDNLLLYQAFCPQIRHQ